MRRVSAVAVQDVVELGDGAVAFDADGHACSLRKSPPGVCVGGRVRHSNRVLKVVSEGVTAMRIRSGWSVRRIGLAGDACEQRTAMINSTLSRRRDKSVR